MATPKEWLRRIGQLQPEPVKIMNVCGGHERAITQAGLRSILPDTIELIPGPGCPVCICPEEAIVEAIDLALNQPITLVAFGDMLRVPVNGKKGEVNSLEQARAAGGDIRPIATPQEAVQLAKAEPQRPVIFFVAGFETTLAPVAAMVAEGIPDNLLLLLAGRRTWPAVDLLLNSPPVQFDALIAPGHVATVMGADEWQFVVTAHQIPTAVSGFTPESLLAGFYSVIRQRQQQRLFVDNCYGELVNPDGNRRAQQWLNQVFDIVDANWRGIGTIAASGYALKPALRHHDARHHYPTPPQQRRRAGEMPPGCDCAAVVLGQKRPNQCRLYAKACTPRTPVGPCMVSDEGACRIWWSG
ncbi:hydrogenase formation protein HypD [Ectothiorhodospiraceae bacterium BW-2]|nr:hydrogenase formation protein HypD [Ectothiorhodospiraceae bacterium BW-2]